MRGENWPIASYTTTIVIVSTNAVSDTIDAAIVDKIPSAASGPPVKVCGMKLKSFASSIAIVPNDNRTPASTQTTGTNHKLLRM
jgi:hypothetical protein